MTQGRIKSIHFPAIQYFALFNGKCIVGKQDCSTLCAPNLSLIRTALIDERNYNLAAIVDADFNTTLTAAGSMVEFMPHV